MSSNNAKRPSVNSASQKELDKVEAQFNAFDKQVKDLTMDRMNAAPKPETEAQVHLTAEDVAKSKEIYLKPKSTVPDRAKFNERFRKEYEFAKEYVNFIAENHEVIGEDLDMWTKPFAGVPIERWMVPTNKAVWGPRYLAEQIKRKSYHRLTMDQSRATDADGMGQYFGSMVAEKTIQRLDARPVSTKKSIFMGSGTF